ncbi:MAG: tetratricopeptide repeat protein [Deltaproteobacteria bacterium]|nr:tetratricopeptide repeat protein [Syntrophaceae bacterium]
MRLLQLLIFPGESLLPRFFFTAMKDDTLSQMLDKADRLSADGKPGAALALLEDCHRKHPGEESVLLRLAWALWDRGEGERSIACWKELLDRELQHRVFTGFAFDELVRIYKQERRHRDLVAVCEKAVHVQPGDVGLLEELGKAYLLSGENAQACRTFEKLAALEPDNPVFFCRLGEALVADGRYDAAEEAYRRAAALDPDEEDRFFLQAADLYLKAGQLSAAKRLVVRCLEIAPDNSLCRCFLGDILAAANETADAFAQYEQACSSDRPHAAAYMNRLGNVLLKAGRPADAVQAFEAALSFDETTPCRPHLERARRAAGR